MQRPQRSGDHPNDERYRALILENIRAVAQCYCARGRASDLITLLCKLDAKIGREKVKELMIEELLEDAYRTTSFPVEPYRAEQRRYHFELSRQDQWGESETTLYGIEATYGRLDRANAGSYWENLRTFSSRLIEEIGPDRTTENQAVRPRPRDAGLRGLHENRHLIVRRPQHSRYQGTPFLAAIWEGRVDICHILIEDFRVNVNTEGTLSITGERMTPLTVAVRRNQLLIANMLLSAGAEPNQKQIFHSEGFNLTEPSQGSPDPLVEACQWKRMDMIKLLLRFGSKIYWEIENGKTILSMAVEENQTEIVQFLLKHGSKPEDFSKFLRAPLYTAIRQGNLEIVKELVKNGAECNYYNEYTISPLLKAADQMRAEIVEYLLTLDVYDPMQRIDALELLGASFAKPDAPDIAACYNYLRRALLERNQVASKTPNVPIQAYENHIESQTLDELEQIKEDPNALLMEALVIRERILSRIKRSSDPFISAVVRNNTVNFKFHKSFILLEHCLTIFDEKVEILQNDFCLMIKAMLISGFKIPVRYFMVVLQTISGEMEKIFRRERSCDSSVRVRTMMYTIVKLIIHKLARDSDMPEEERRCLITATRDAHYWIQGILDEYMRSLVRDTFDNTEQSNGNAPYPSLRIFKVLIELGVDLNATGRSGYTVLQFVVADSRQDWIEHHFESIIRLLFENGAHPDMTCPEGKTPLELVTDERRRVTLRSLSGIRLKCLAARAVQKHRIPMCHIDSTCIKEFVDMHRTYPRVDW